MKDRDFLALGDVLIVMNLTYLETQMFISLQRKLPSQQRCGYHSSTAQGLSCLGKKFQTHCRYFMAEKVLQIACRPLCRGPVSARINYQAHLRNSIWRHLRTLQDIGL